MGLLSLGTPLNWQQTKKHCCHVKDHGIVQLLHVWQTHRDRNNDPALWGDELEYMIVELNAQKQVARLTLRQEDILDALITAGKSGKFTGVSFHQEYGRYMLEATPQEPYSTTTQSLLTVEPNMHNRRAIAQAYLKTNEVPLTLTTYPRLGAGQFAAPWDESERVVSRSTWLPDNIINTHARFPTLTANIRERRGEKVDIRVPIFKDKHTTGEIVQMDAMGFGMGSSCLQLTFQAQNISKARDLFDQLVPFAPLFLALSAAAPLFRGHVSDQDVRWNVISASVDDRTPVERGIVPPPSDWQQHTNNSSPTIPKSRYDSVDCYIGTNKELQQDIQQLNDVQVVTNLRSFKQLRDAGMDATLAQHFAHLFARDPLVIFKELLDQNDEESTDHFENIQSTNWQTIRFKPPPNREIGWRVEFRSMDVQITDFENAAFAVFLVLLTRYLISSNKFFYLPISKVDENMKTAHQRDGVAEKYWWKFEDGIRKAHLSEILGGIIAEIRASQNDEQIHKYIDLVADRASLKKCTAAHWIRSFVTGHADYKGDSIVTEKINYDLMCALEQITLGKRIAEFL